jgi:hypothetical protein
MKDEKIFYLAHPAACDLAYLVSSVLQSNLKA